MMTFKDTIISIFKDIYKKDLGLQSKYKTEKDFFNAIQNTKNVTEFKEILKDIKL